MAIKSITRTQNNRFSYLENKTVHGAYGEKFSSNLTAVFPIPSNDPKVGYYVYLFRGDKYCFRAIRPPKEISDEEYCPEWRDNLELFGCHPSSTPQSDTSSPIITIMVIVVIVIVVLVVFIAFVVYLIMRGQDQTA